MSNRFFIDEKHLEMLSITKRFVLKNDTIIEIDKNYVFTEDDTWNALLGNRGYSITSLEDTAEFSILRNKLGLEGFIFIETSYHNGDRVLKPFYLNDKLFKTNDIFYCSSALLILFLMDKRDKKSP